MEMVKKRKGSEERAGRDTLRAKLSKYLESKLQLRWEPWGVFDKRILPKYEGVGRAGKWERLREAKLWWEEHLETPLFSQGVQGDSFSQQDPSLVSEHKGIPWE